MAESDAADNEDVGHDKAPPDPPGTNLAAFLINTHKIRDSLEGAIAGNDANITLTDWLMLQALNSEGPLHASKVGIKVGITRQRVDQQIAPLKRAGILEFVEADGKKNLLTLTPKGGELVQRFEDKFLTLLSADPRLTPESMLRSARASTRRIMRVLTKVTKAEAKAE
jgi:DNA-binding MarR family transcriptional regulator